jgi:SNF family Na+-dependent transporter
VNSTTSESWSGRLAFILASIGAAVGLGNIWKFPYTLGSSGGSAFVLVYVLAILLVATPIMIAAWLDGIVCAVPGLEFLQRHRRLDGGLFVQVRERLAFRFVA